MNALVYDTGSCDRCQRYGTSRFVTAKQRKRWRHVRRVLRRQQREIAMMEHLSATNRRSFFRF